MKEISDSNWNFKLKNYIQTLLCQKLWSNLQPQGNACFVSVTKGKSKPWKTDQSYLFPVKSSSTKRTLFSKCPTSIASFAKVTSGEMYIEYSNFRSLFGSFSKLENSVNIFSSVDDTLKTALKSTGPSVRRFESWLTSNDVTRMSIAVRFGSASKPPQCQYTGVQAVAGWEFGMSSFEFGMISIPIYLNKKLKIKADAHQIIVQNIMNKKTYVKKQFVVLKLLCKSPAHC